MGYYSVDLSGIKPVKKILINLYLFRYDTSKEGSTIHFSDNSSNKGIEYHQTNLKKISTDIEVKFSNYLPFYKRVKNPPTKNV